MSAAGKFEDQLAIQQFPVKASGKSCPMAAPPLPYSRATVITRIVHVMSTITSITVRARRNTARFRPLMHHSL